MKKTIVNNCNSSDEYDINFYIVRHATTYANLTKLKNKYPDTPLTDIGIKQSEIAGKYLKNIDIDLTCCSLLSRTIETLFYIRKSILETNKYNDLNIYPIPFITEKQKGIGGLFEVNKDNFPYIFRLMDKTKIIKDKRKHLLDYNRKELYPDNKFNVSLNLLLYKIVLRGLYGDNYNNIKESYLELSDFNKFKTHCVPLILNYLRNKYPNKKKFNIVIVTHGQYIRHSILPNYKLENRNCMVLKLPYNNKRFLTPCLIFKGFKKGKLY